MFIGKCVYNLDRIRGVKAPLFTKSGLAIDCIAQTVGYTINFLDTDPEISFCELIIITNKDIRCSVEVTKIKGITTQYIATYIHVHEKEHSYITS